MCLGRRPSPPPLPEAEPVDSAIEATATKVAIGDDRTMGQPKTKKKKTGQKVAGGKIARAIAPKRLITGGDCNPKTIKNIPNLISTVTRTFLNCPQ